MQLFTLDRMGTDRVVEHTIVDKKNLQHGEVLAGAVEADLALQGPGGNKPSDEGADLSDDGSGDSTLFRQHGGWGRAREEYR